MTHPNCSPDECANAQHYPSNDLQRLEEKLDAVLAISQKVERIADSVASQVKPVLDDLMKSPLLKMLGVKKS